MEIGFIILSHQNPGLLRRLILRLNHSFGDPPIVCHHDFHQTTLNKESFPSNVRFVPEPVRTRWGHITVVRAVLLALRQLYDWKAPDWFVHLSGSDYPIKGGDGIHSELLCSPYDAYLDYRPIEYGTLPKEKRDSAFELGFRRPFWTRVAYDRYVARRIPYLWINRKAKLCTRRFPLRHPVLTSPRPFKKLTCFAGDAWMSGRRRCAELLLSPDNEIQALLDHYADRVVPEESFFHTVLCNAPGLKLCNDNKRYEDWTAGELHPKTLGLEDLPKLISSGQHFARKFSDLHDPRVLDELDRVI